eukprot:TRINITY_DN432_c4_g1_i1.p1 TRINITY_DN432_c4_g1~~TRINITY_DN432_c4_g1_i1.p1  ORF type:complete len:668 (+),score=65.58 TRINITY_DN432_c4_g1_i1:38-2005(+)
MLLLWIILVLELPFAVDSLNCSSLFNGDDWKWYRLGSGSVRPEVRDELHLQSAIGNYGVCFEMGSKWGKTIYDDEISHLPYLNGGTKFCAVSDPKLQTIAELCIPTNCTPDDVREMLASTGLLNLLVFCDTDATGLEKDWGFYVAICLISVSMLLTLIATLRKPKQQPNKLSQILSVWDARKNMTILTAARHDRPGRCTSWLDFLRVVSMVWIIIGHTFLYISTYPTLSNPHHMVSVLHSFSSFPVTSSYYAIETFLFLSGYFAAMTLMINIDRSPDKYSSFSTGLVTTLQTYLGRILRLLPPLVLCILIAVHVVPQLLQGPKSWKYINLPTIDACYDRWWTAVLFISNFYPEDLDQTCLEWSWYISVDLQLFVILPFVLLPYALNKPNSITPSSSLIRKMMPMATYIMLGICLLSNFYWSVKNEVVPDHGPLSNNYVWTNNRGSAYCYGVMCQLILHGLRMRTAPWAPLRRAEGDFDDAPFLPSINDDEPRVVMMGNMPVTPTMTTRFRVLCYVGSCVVFLQNVVLNWYSSSRRVVDNEEPRWAHRLYAFDYVFGWGLGLSLLTIPLTMGHGQMIKPFLSHPLWATLSRLTLGVYLFHPLILLILLSSDTPFLLTLPSYSSVCFSTIFISFLFSFFTFFTFEAPLGGLCKLLLK